MVEERVVTELDLVLSSKDTEIDYLKQIIILKDREIDRLTNMLNQYIRRDIDDPK